MTSTHFIALHETVAHAAALVGSVSVAVRRYGFCYWFSTGVPEAMS